MKGIIQIHKSSKSVESLDDNLEYNKPRLLKLKNSIDIEVGTRPGETEGALTNMGFMYYRNSSKSTS